MLYRSIYIGNPAHLKLKDKQLKITDPSTQIVKGSVPIEDLGLLMLDHYQITVSHQLLQELMKNNVVLISCDEKHLPLGAMLPFSGNTQYSERVKTQLEVSEPLKKQLWKQTVECKIQNQAKVLEHLGKYVEAAKGTNLFFGVYQGKGKRTYATIPLNEVIERQKQGLPSVPERNEKGEPLLFSLSPNDLVYVPMEGEIAETIDFNNLSKEQKERIYKTVSFTGNQCFFVQEAVASPIVNKMEYSPLNKMERSIVGIMIKEVCIKLKVDRLGNITKA